MKNGVTYHLLPRVAATPAAAASVVAASTWFAGW